LPQTTVDIMFRNSALDV